MLLHLGDKSAGYVHEQTTILSSTCSQVLRYSLDGKDVPTPLAQANTFAAVGLAVALDSLDDFIYHVLLVDVSVLTMDDSLQLQDMRTFFFMIYCICLGMYKCSIVI